MVDSDRNSTELYGDHFAGDGCGVGVGEPQMRIDGTRYLGNYISYKPWSGIQESSSTMRRRRHRTLCYC